MNGSVIINDSVFSPNAAMQAGSKHFGVTVELPATIQLGPYGHPWVRLSIKKKKPSGKPKTRKKIMASPPIKYLKPVFRSLQWEQVDLTGWLGLESAALTGVIFGVLQLLRAGIHSSRFKLNVEPVFRSKLDTDLTGKIQIKLVPIILVWNVAKVYCNVS